MSTLVAHPALDATTDTSRSTYSIARIDGTRLNVANESEAIARVIADATAGRGGTLFTLNVDHLVKLRRDVRFRAAYERATYVTADGMPVALVARTRGAPIERVTGADLVVPLCRAAAEQGVPIHIFGTTDPALKAAAARLQSLAPGLRVAGLEAPSFGFDPQGATARAAAERIAASGARICFVALGAPKQEVFANSAMLWTRGVVYVCVGAAVDFLAGRQHRAPRVLRDVGLEWLWRLVCNPRRLGSRYVKSAVYLVCRSFVVAGRHLLRLGRAVVGRPADPLDRDWA